MVSEREVILKLWPIAQCLSHTENVKKVLEMFSVFYTAKWLSAWLRNGHYIDESKPVINNRPKGSKEGEAYKEAVIVILSSNHFSLCPEIFCSKDHFQ